MKKPRRPSKSAVKAAADRAENVAPDDPADLGRPTDYKPEFVIQAQKLCELGATDVELADFFGVSGRTIYRWQIKYPDFCQALKTGKEAVDDRVERSLFHKAVGYTFESEKIFQHQGEIVRAATREHVPPDTTAMIFWLKNRRPHYWRDVHKVEHGAAGDFEKMTPDELRDSIARDLAQLGIENPAAANAGAKSASGRKPH